MGLSSLKSPLPAKKTGGQPPRTTATLVCTIEVASLRRGKRGALHEDPVPRRVCLGAAGSLPAPCQLPRLFLVERPSLLFLRRASPPPVTLPPYSRIFPFPDSLQSVRKCGFLLPLIILGRKGAFSSCFLCHWIHDSSVVPPPIFVTYPAPRRRHLSRLSIPHIPAV